MTDTQKQQWALISVFSKDGIVDFANALVARGWKVLSSGGTAKALREGGVEVKDVAELVGGGAILGHRVVTLSREVHTGLLANPWKADDIAELERLGVPQIDMVVCDFYPLDMAISTAGAMVESVVEMTDIGGPTMVRSAAKGDRIVVCRPQDRQLVLDQLASHGDVMPATRQRLRAIAEFEVARYVLASARFHGSIVFNAGAWEKTGGCSMFEGFVGELVMDVKGENAWQHPAGFYAIPGNSDPLALQNFTLVEGNAPSYNNLSDLDGALRTLRHMGAALKAKAAGRMPFMAVGVKHANPCGAAFNFDSTAETLRYMVTGDDLAIFGGLAICNFPINMELARILVEEGMPDDDKRVLDCVVAPSIDPEAVEVLKRKTGRCRVMVNPSIATACDTLDTSLLFRSVTGGFLVQPCYTFVLDMNDQRMVVTGERIRQHYTSLLLAWAVGSMSKSNTITIVSGGMVIGNGAGQQSRVGAAKLAVSRAIDAGHGDKLDGAVAYSDSFFPFTDAPEVLIKAGIKAVFATSGSRNDDSVREVFRQAGVTLYQLPDEVARGFCH